MFSKKAKKRKKLETNGLLIETQLTSQAQRTLTGDRTEMVSGGMNNNQKFIALQLLQDTDFHKNK